MAATVPLVYLISRAGRTSKKRPSTSGSTHGTTMRMAAKSLYWLKTLKYVLSIIFKRIVTDAAL
jgi:hypothetical protein